MMTGVGEGFHGATTPWHNRNLRLLSQKFGTDLVAQPAHGVTVGTDEHYANFAAEVCEFRVLGDKAPSHADRICTCTGQCSLKQSVVEIAALAGLGTGFGSQGSAQEYGFVRLTHEHGVAVRLCEERNGAERSCMFLIELANCMDETHGGCAAIDNSHALKFVLHKAPKQPNVRAQLTDHAETASSDMASCRAFKGSALTAPVRATVR
jgi:hypothetical protein